MNQSSNVVFALLLAAAAGLIGLLFLTDSPRTASSGKPLIMFCASGMKVPITEVANRFQEETGIPVQVQFGGSGTLLSGLQVAGGDLYLAADASYLELAEKKNLADADDIMAVSHLTGGLGVPRGNPKGIRNLDDLRRPGLDIGIAIPEAASIGMLTKKILLASGHWAEVHDAAKLTTFNVNELANALKLGTIDVALVWDAIAEQYPEIDFIHLPEFDRERTQVTIGMLTSSKQPAQALAFVRYLTASDRGLPVFQRTGYEIIEGTAWKDAATTPELRDSDKLQEDRK